jgi:hypothetical protein
MYRLPVRSILTSSIIFSPEKTAPALEGIQQNTHQKKHCEKRRSLWEQQSQEIYSCRSRWNLSPDGQLAISGSGDKRLREWDAAR